MNVRRQADCFGHYTRAKDDHCLVSVMNVRRQADCFGGMKMGASAKGRGPLEAADRSPSATGCAKAV
jgi:predicted metalloprotease